MSTTTLPICYVTLCSIAKTAVLVAPPIRYTTRIGETPEATETDLIVVLMGAMGTRYMIWRESPAVWDGPPLTSIHPVQPDSAGGLASELIDDCGVPRELLINDLALTRLVVESAGALGTASGAITRELEKAIITACRAAISADVPS